LAIIEPGEAMSPLVLAVDVGSSSVRALLYDARGRALQGTEHQVHHTLETSVDGGSTADPDTLVSLVASCIDETYAAAGTRQDDIAAVGITTFWHGMLGLDADRTPTTPVLMWADTRSSVDARELDAAHMGFDPLQRTGCRLHSSYWPAKLRWLLRTDPATFTTTSSWVSFADYLAWRFHGELVTSISMASGTGLLEATSLTWMDEMIGRAGIRREQLPPIIDRDTALPPLTAEWSNRWPALSKATWFPAIGDGATANIGANCVGPDRIALTIGTSGAMRAIVDDTHHAPISPRLWKYRLDRHSAVTGGALSNGGNILAWLGTLSRSGDLEALSAQAADIAPDSHGLTVLPLLAGERSPSWDDRLGGTVSGLRLDTSAPEIFRAFMEATAYRLASIYEALGPLVRPDHVIFASGGALLRSSLWMQIVADALGHDLLALDPGAEASARGVAICALHAIGALDSIRMDPGPDLVLYTPDQAHHETYRAARERQERLESALAGFIITTHTNQGV
jgi:gluconokinase